LKSIVSPSKVVTAAFSVVFSLGIGAALGQAPATPSDPTPQAPAGARSQAAPPSAPVAPVDPLPPSNPKFFTASSPSVDDVNSFLHQIWGFDPNRLFRVMAIQPTPAPQVTKVVIFVTEKGTDKVQAATFYVTPDGKHAIGEGTGVVPFGPKPFAPIRELLRSNADGAYRGAASKDLELVEFADLQCPHCKEAEATMDQIVKDFPNARVVFQPFPLVGTHPSAFKAAAYGVCVQKQSNDAFFKYADGVFDSQEALTPTTDDTVLKAAVKRAGLDSDVIAACANTQATKDVVNGDIKLAEEAGVEQTPLLSINGRMMPLGGTITYDQIKQIIQFQATLDGVNSGATAETLKPKPVQPKLSDLPK
jgi:protein-disulfide isomerase